MDRYKNALDRFAADTEASDFDRARYDRLVDRVVAGEPRPSRAWLPWAGLALAGAAALAVGLSLPDRSDPVGGVVDHPAEAPLQLALTDHVEVEASGRGAFSGTRGAPVYDLTEGRVLFSVTPEQGVDLRVRTEEAEVRVLGTVFEVARTALGTEVSVQRGTVAVRCTDGQAMTLTAEQAGTCLPVTATGLLDRALALEAAGAAPAQVRAAVDAGLGRAPDDSIRAELLKLRLDLALSANEPLSALSDARAYIALGAPEHRAHALQAAALLSFSTGGGCAGAEPYVRQLLDEGHALREDLAAACPR